MSREWGKPLSSYCEANADGRSSRPLAWDCEPFEPPAKITVLPNKPRISLVPILSMMLAVLTAIYLVAV